MPQDGADHDASGAWLAGPAPDLPDAVEFIDCTLRDGEQAPGVWLTIAEKRRLAVILDDIGVDVLDAGFPANSASEVEAMQEMRRLGLRVRIAATARPLPGDVAAAELARAQEVFLFMPTSDFRLRETLGLTRQQATAMFRAGAEDVVSRGMGLNLVFEDASRADPALLVSVVDSLRKHVPIGRLILADTVGCATPLSMDTLIRTMRHALGDDIALCPHCHNDFGLAVANTLTAVCAGASAVTCTVNGIGERAGNADLAEVAAGLAFLYGIAHNIDLTGLQTLSQLVERMSGIHTSATKPVTGLNVFRHESGVHVDGMLKTSRSYEFLPAAAVGRQTEYILGKHSGTALVRKALQDAGIEAGDDLIAELLQQVKATIEQRDKGDHERMYWRMQAFHASQLSGVAAEEIVKLAQSRRAQQEQREPPATGCRGNAVNHRARPWDAP